MKLSRLLDRRAGYSLASLGLLLGLVAPAVIPAFASAAQLTTRSITMSTSATSTSATYNIKFTGTASISATASAEGGVAVEFCSNTAVLGDTCTRPTGMTTSSATLSDVKYNGSSTTTDGSIDNNGPNAEEGSIVWTAGEAYTGGQTLELIISGIQNPSAIGVFYARVTTYTNATNRATYTGVTVPGTYADEGSMALAATGGIGVTAYVLESMSFCVSRGDIGNTSNATAISTQAEPSEDCGSGEADCTAPGVDAGCVVSPSMTIGKDDGSGNTALASDTLATGRVWAQLSSNASGSTVVNLKSDAASCGGLYRNGNTANCEISPHTNTSATFTAGTAAFGLRVGTATAAPVVAGTGGSGTGTITTSGSYDANDFFIDYVAGNATGVTSTYGSSLFSTTGAVDNMNVPVTFGASITNNTPAGTYGATLSMIAVGTF